MGASNGSTPTAEKAPEAGQAGASTEQLVPVQPSTPTPAQTPAQDSDGLGAKIINLITSFTGGKARQSRSAVSAADEKTLAELSIEADTPISEIVNMLSRATGDTAEVIASIDEDKEHPVGRLIVGLFVILGYIAPPVASGLMGIAIGIQYSGGALSFQGAAVFVACLIYEAALVWLMFAMAKKLRAYSSSHKGLLTFFGLLSIYVFIAVTSALAQWVIYERNINPADHIQVAGAAFRTLAIPVVDLVVAIALPILQHITLDKKISDMRKKTEATIAINKQKMDDQVAKINAAVAIKSTMQKEQDYQKKNDLANSLIDLVSKKIIADAERSVTEDKAPNNSYRRDGYR